MRNGASEATTMRVQSLLPFGALAAIVILAVLTKASKAGGPGGAATFPALNFAESVVPVMGATCALLACRDPDA